MHEKHKLSPLAADRAPHATVFPKILSITASTSTWEHDCFHGWCDSTYAERDGEQRGTIVMPVQSHLISVLHSH